MTATDWVLEHGATSPNDALAGLGALPAGCSATWSAAGCWPAPPWPPAGCWAMDVGRLRPGVPRAKIATARFYATNILPQAGGLLGAVTAGAGDLYAIEPKYLAG